MSPLLRYWGAVAGMIGSLVALAVLIGTSDGLPSYTKLFVFAGLALGFYACFVVRCPKCRLLLVKRRSGGSRGIATRYCPECGYDLTTRRYQTEPVART